MSLQNKVVTHITLYADASAPNSPSYIYAKQKDLKSRYIIATIKDSNNVIDIHGAVRLNATRPDGSHVYISGVVNEDNTVTIELSQNLLAMDGKVSCDLSILGAGDDNQSLLTTSTFFILVDESNYDSDAIEGEDELPAQVNGLVSDVDEESGVAKVYLAINGNPIGTGAELPSTDVSYLTIQNGELCMIFEEEEAN